MWRTEHVPFFFLASIRKLWHKSPAKRAKALDCGLLTSQEWVFSLHSLHYNHLNLGELSFVFCRDGVHLAVRMNNASTNLGTTWHANKCPCKVNFEVLFWKVSTLAFSFGKLYCSTTTRHFFYLYKIIIEINWFILACLYTFKMIDRVWPYFSTPGRYINLFRRWTPWSTTPTTHHAAEPWPTGLIQSAYACSHAESKWMCSETRMREHVWTLEVIQLICRYCI